MLLVRLLINRKLLVKFGRSQNLYMDFFCCVEASVLLTLKLFRDHLSCSVSCFFQTLSQRSLNVYTFELAHHLHGCLILICMNLP